MVNDALWLIALTLAVASTNGLPSTGYPGGSTLTALIARTFQRDGGMPRDVIDKDLHFSVDADLLEK
jgi:hypothetical protein